MARTYWTTGPATAPDGQSVDAYTVRDLLIGNAEAAYEIGSWDTCETLPLFETVTDVDSSWVYGPAKIPMRRDRSGAWRTYYVEPLVAANTVDETLQIYLLPSWREPHAGDQVQSWTVSAGALDWGEAKAFQWGRDEGVSQYLIGPSPSIRWGYLLCRWYGVTDKGYFGGLHIWEEIAP